jgi:hypothetical protein
MFCSLTVAGTSGTLAPAGEDKSMVFKMIDKMLTNKKFKDFFAKNVATL